jgi:hypothetical protein
LSRLRVVKISLRVQIFKDTTDGVKGEKHTFMMVGPRNHSSPASPSPASISPLPSPSTKRRASRLGKRNPILPTLDIESSSRRRWVFGDVSVRPKPMKLLKEAESENVEERATLNDS